MLNRKVKKLIRDPKLFFSDMFQKQKKKVSTLNPKKYDGNYQYTVVSAVYNVGRYLDEYFNSLIQQHLNFKKHIHLILVDDGSTDNSAAIIKSWMKKYPNNITYIYKDNGGQASARNLGLESVITEWVTFIDPDDFVDINYFKSIDCFIKSNELKDIKFISNNFIYYFEDLRIYKDSHPLKHRFKHGDKLFPCNALDKQIQLSVNSAIFKTSIIADKSVRFSEVVKPNFEDAHFVSSYMMNELSGEAAFLKSAKYYYRKRSDASSTLDTAWENRGLYTDVLEYGCLDILNNYKNKEISVPNNVQITVLYHLFWYVKKITNNSQKIDFLDVVEQEKFKKLLIEIFKFIDTKTIMEFSLAGCWFYHRVGLLNYFKDTNPNFQIVYLESYDAVKGLLEIKYFTGRVSFEYISEDRRDITPYFTKTIKHEFLNEYFLKERRLWVPITNAKKLKIAISNTPTRISLAGKQYNDGINTDTVIKLLNQQKPNYDISKEFVDSWLFMDRDIQADDNAEHLYDYVQKNHPSRKIYFALRKDSHDWERLYKKSFNLVEFGSSTHEKILKSCSKVISSHIDKYVTNYLGPKMLVGRHFIFLQHGVIKDDLSNWLNQKDNIDIFVTTSNDEYHSIINNETPYKFSKNNVKLTGLARYDNLLTNNEKVEKIILIMPTWRASIMGKTKENSNTRELSSEFINTNYYRHWFSLLHSEALKLLTREFEYKIIFFPHANISPYLSLFKTPEYIEVHDHTKGSIQDLFKKSSLMITDYSSVAFDMAIQGKQTLYYQFDEKEVFSGGHIYKKGYFDYRKDGFGAVAVTESSLLEYLQTALENSAIPNTEIQKRINSTFPNRDARNCERTYEAILELDKPLPDSFSDNDIILEYALQASEHKKWSLAASRWDKIVTSENKVISEKAQLGLIEALRENGQIDSAIIKFEEYFIKNKVNFNNKHFAEQAQNYMACHQWLLASHAWEKTTLETDKEKVHYAVCLSELGEPTTLDAYLNTLPTSLIEKEKVIFNIAKDISIGNWESVTLAIKGKSKNISDYSPTNYKHEILLARCLRNTKDITGAKLQLKNYASNNNINLEYNIESALVFASAGEWINIEALFKDINMSYLPANIVYIYLKSLRLSGKHFYAFKELNKIPENICDNLDVKVEKAKLLTDTKQWKEASQIWLDLLNDHTDARLQLARAYRMIGMLEEALQLLCTDVRQEPINIDEWILRAELYQLTANWEQAQNCWSLIISHFPEGAPPESWDRLQHAQLMLNISSLPLTMKSIENGIV